MHPSSNASDLSTNLLGIFNHENGKIKIKGENSSYYNTRCLPDYETDTPKFLEDFVVDNQRLFWHILIGDIENFPIEYLSRNKNSKAFSAKCKVKHTPMRWNFWHFSIRWIIFEEDSKSFDLNSLDSNRQKRYIKQIVSEFRSFLSMNAILENNFSQREITERDYLK